jgi:predicted flap endonuclease-1-like 5' DNA nuclease
MFEQNVTLSPGTESFAAHTAEIIFMLAVSALLGYLLHWLMAKAAYVKLQAELEVERRHRRTLENDFDRLRAEHSAMGSRISTLEGDITGARGDLAQSHRERDDAKSAWAAVNSEFATLKAGGADKTERNAALDVELASARTELSASLANRDALAAELERLREKLVQQQNAAIADMPKAGAADDLKVIEGIGPKINELLNQAGIASFHQLRDATTERLRSILQAAGERYRIHDPSSWPEQAALCASGNWEALKRLQDQLTAGRV